MRALISLPVRHRALNELTENCCGMFNRNTQIVGHCASQLRRRGNCKLADDAAMVRSISGPTMMQKRVRHTASNARFKKQEGG